jgi:hypothetical protein
MSDKDMDALWDACTLAIRLQKSGFSPDESVEMAASPQDGIELARGPNGQACFVIRRGDK